MSPRVASLRPYPFSGLVRRALRELETKGSVFELPARKFVVGSGARDISARIHGHETSTPLGPAAGPHSQLAQNIALSWLAGGRAIELKTVQILDRLTIPRPCIDAATVGYNVEWSQELTLEQSLEEYVKGSMLIEILAASGALALEPGFARTALDVSVGYDLAGIEGERVQGFLRGITDATAIVDRLRREIPDEYRRLRDVDFTTRIAGSATVSTFHGCPPEEIERIALVLLRKNGLSCTLKLNPTLLGEGELYALLHGALGYNEIRAPEGAFERDTSWEQAAGIFERTGPIAASLGLGLGVKLTNTLVVKNHKDVFKGSGEMYLSGAPLHVLAMHLVRRFRERFGDRFPVAFSGGIDWSNFADAVALGLGPITVCTDWLRPGGYGRAHRYFDELFRRMDLSKSKTRGDFIVRAFGQGRAALAKIGLSAEATAACARALDEGADLRAAAGDAAYAEWVSAAALLNTEAYVGGLASDPRYDRAHNAKGPKKIATHLTLLDCITCDKCVPVCPNAAVFTLPVPRTEFPIVTIEPGQSGLERRRSGTLRVEEKHQIATYADVCNECGNCDVFCPEDGGPQIVKPRFFGDRAAFMEEPRRDGLFVERRGGALVILGRHGEDEYQIELEGGRGRYSGAGFDLTFDPHAPEATAQGRAAGSVDMTRLRVAMALAEAAFAPGEASFVNCREGSEVAR